MFIRVRRTTVRTLMKKQKLTIRGLARLIGMDAGQVSRVLRGQPCGSSFVSRMLNAFPDNTFEELFILIKEKEAKQA